MKSRLLLCCCFSLVSLLAFNQPKQNPLIKSYGAVWSIPDADHKPDPSIEYKVLIELTENSAKPDTMNIYLEAVATLINLHAVEGVPAKNLKVVVVLRKMATNAVFNNEWYKERFKTHNPNLQLIKELAGAGVEFYVCGQTLIRAKIDKSKLVPEAKVASAVLSTMTTLQLQGYAPIKF